jgi:hypothetical protein
LECVQYKEAHDAEILTVSYSANRKGLFLLHFSKYLLLSVDELLLATGSRDRLIHIFDVNDNYNLLTTLDDHSSSITSLRFATEGSKLLSCSADKSIIFRNITRNPFNVTRYCQAIVQYGTVYDMDVDPINKFIVTSGQDKKLSIYTINTGKPARSYKVEESSGEVIKVRLDPAGIYAATSSSDKNIRLYDYWTGECLAKLSGHSELVTGLVFTPNCKRLISVSGDSCIFVWRLSQELTSNIQERLAELKIKSSLPPNVNIPKESSSPTAATSVPLSNPILTAISTTDVNLQLKEEEEEEDEENTKSDKHFTLNDTSLPAWAKGKGESKTQAEKFAPRGRWAQRVNPNEGVPLFSELSDVEKPIAKLLENIERRYTIEITPEDKENFFGTWRLAKQMQSNSIPAEEDISKRYEASTNNTSPPPTLSTSPKQYSIPGRPSSMANLPAPEEEDAVLYASDPEEEVEEEPTANTLQSTQQQPSDADAEVTEYYGQSPRSAPAFESDVQLSDAKTNDEEKKVEEESEEVPDEETALEDFQDPEKADFLKSNFLFDNNAALAKKTNVTRLSISSKFLLRPPIDIKLPDNNNNATIVTDNKVSPPPPSSKKQDAAFAKELEKVKQRLAQMGLNFSHTNEAEVTTTSDSPLSPSVTEVISPRTSTEDKKLVALPQSIEQEVKSNEEEEEEDIAKDLQMLKDSLTGPTPVVSASPVKLQQSSSVQDSIVENVIVPVTESQSTLPLPLDYYSKSIYDFQSSLDNIVSLFKDVQQANNSHPSDINLGSLLATFTNALQSSQQKIASTIAPTEASVSYPPLANNASMNTTSLLLTSSMDLNKTIELYSNMLLQAVKDKLEKK